MKAPISKRVLKILSDKKNADTLLQAMMTKEKSNVIKIDGKKYELRRVANYTKH